LQAGGAVHHAAGVHAGEVERREAAAAPQAQRLRRGVLRVHWLLLQAGAMTAIIIVIMILVVIMVHAARAISVAADMVVIMLRACERAGLAGEKEGAGALPCITRITRVPLVAHTRGREGRGHTSKTTTSGA